MRKNLIRNLLALSVSAAAVSASAQPAIMREYVEHPGYSIGVNFGMSDLWGDVGTKSFIDHYGNGKYFNKPCFMGGVFGRFTPHPMIAARLGVNYGTLYATDAWNEKKAKSASSPEADEYQRYLRNQDVRANVWEGSLLLEFMPMRMNSESRAASKRLQPYIAAGVATFTYRPQTSLINPITGAKKWVDIRDLHLEGEDLEYTKATEHHSKKSYKWVMSVPVGLGLRWDINREMAIGAEYLFRFTTTDRLDGVSSEYASAEYFDKNLPPEKAAIAKQVYDKSWAIDPSVKHDAWTPRGNKEIKDNFSTISIMFIYKINSNKLPWWY